MATSGDPDKLAAQLDALRSTAGERGLAVVAAWIAGMGVPRNDRAALRAELERPEELERTLDDKENQR